MTEAFTDTLLQYSRAKMSSSVHQKARMVLATNVEESDRAMAADGTTKVRLYLHHQLEGEFQHNNYTFV